MRRHYRFKRDVLLALLDSHLTTWFEWKKPRGGMHVLIELKPNFVPILQTEMALDQLIAQELAVNGVQLSPLSSHYIFSQKEPNNARFGFLLGFSGPKEEEMTYIVNILQNWLCANLVEKSLSNYKENVLEEW
jgi:GntR family transcriptional regulator/MocR family aminotransferase